MMYRRSVGALLAAAVVFGTLNADQAGAFGPRRAAYGAYYGDGDSYGAPYGYFYNPYSYNLYGMPFPADDPYYYNPYVAPFPAYGILPPPFATMRMTYGAQQQRTDVRRERPPERSAEDLVADVTRFRFEVTVPTEDAIVLVGGAKTTQTGLKRTYVTPPLVVDKLYNYSVEVQWTDVSGAAKSQKTSFEFLLGYPTKHLHFPLMTK